MNKRTAIRVAEILCPPSPKANDALAAAWFEGANVDGARLVENATHCYQTNFGAVYSDVPPNADDFDDRLAAQVIAKFGVAP